MQPGTCSDRLRSSRILFDPARPICPRRRDATNPTGTSKIKFVRLTNIGEGDGKVPVHSVPTGSAWSPPSDDGTARVWDLSGPRPTGTLLEGHKDRTISAAFSPDGGHVVTVSGGTAGVFPVPLFATLVEDAKRSLTRCLTTAQRKEFGLSPSTQARAYRYEITSPPCR
jgi:WD40 repeat protein